MQKVAKSGAMDAALHGAGPGTRVLPSIIGGEPATVLQYVTDLTTSLSTLVTLFEQLKHNQQQLKKAWPTGTGTDSAAQTLTAAGQNFGQLAGAVNQGTSELATAAKWIQVVQQAYQTIVGGTNPTVATLLSNPHTRPAATAVSAAATGGLTGFLGTANGVLSTIGFTRVLGLVSSLLQVASQVEQLLSPQSSAGTGAATVSSVTVPTTPATPTPSTGSVTTDPSGRMVVTLPARC